MSNRYADLSKFKDIHKGERCFVILTGPSLTLEDVEMLKDETTFAVNSCFKLFSKTSWRPSYYVLTDVLIYKKMGKEIESSDMNCPLFYSRNGLKAEIKKENAYPFRSNYIKHMINYFSFGKTRLGWSNDINKWIADGTSCIYSVMQIIQYMGFNEVYVIGADCNYSLPKQHSDLASYKPLIKVSKNGGEHVLISWKSIKYHLEKRNNQLKVYNSTRGGMLELFPRISLEEVLKKEETRL